MTQHQMPAPQDATKMRLNLNMLYDPATALANGEALFIQGQPTATAPDATEGAEIRELCDRAVLKAMDHVMTHLFNLRNLAHALDHLTIDPPVSLVNSDYPRALVGISDAIMQEIEAAMKLTS